MRAWQARWWNCTGPRHREGRAPRKWCPLASEGGIRSHTGRIAVGACEPWTSRKSLVFEGALPA